MTARPTTSPSSQQVLGLTQSACGQCGEIVPARVVAREGGVHFVKFCARHGEQEVFVHGDSDEYLRAQRYVKPAWMPAEFAGDARRPCPDACGFCGRHEQHLCLPIVEITQRCDLACPACLVDAGRGENMSLGRFRDLLEALIRAERQIDLLNLSGGEPLMHPQLCEIIDEALSRPEIVRVSISTNGLKLLDDPDLLSGLRDRDVVISLQFDGYDDDAYRLLRGRPLLEEKLQLLERLGRADITTSLTMTAAGEVNDQQFRPVLDCLFSNRHIVSLMIQPLAFAGRGRSLAGTARRLTIPDVIKALGEAGHPSVGSEDFVPLPCSHPHCFSLAYYLVLEDGAVSVNRLTDAGTIMDAMANRTVVGLDAREHERLKSLIYELWSGPAASIPEGEAVMKAVRGILRDASCACFDPRKAFSAAERRVKSIFIHAFQDADSFDLARVRRCCNAYPQADGSLVPACVRNVLRR